MLAVIRTIFALEGLRAALGIPCLHTKRDHRRGFCTALKSVGLGLAGVVGIVLLGCPRPPAQETPRPSETAPQPSKTVQGAVPSAATAPDRLAPIVGIPAHTLFFAQGSAGLNLNAQVLLDGVAEVMRAEPTRRLMVEGHTDEKTEKEQSETLAQQRAQAVVRYLTRQHGLPPERFETAAIGHVRPFAPPEVPGGTARNRRVEFWWVEGTEGG